MMVMLCAHLNNLANYTKVEENTQPFLVETNNNTFLIDWFWIDCIFAMAFCSMIYHSSGLSPCSLANRCWNISPRWSSFHLEIKKGREAKGLSDICSVSDFWINTDQQISQMKQMWKRFSHRVRVFVCVRPSVYVRTFLFSLILLTCEPTLSAFCWIPIFL